MKLISWLKNSSILGKNLGFTINRSILLVLILAFSTSIIFPSLIAIALGINTGLRKGHAGWVLTLVQTGMLWPVFHFFQFTNPAAPQIQYSGLLAIMLLTLSTGLLGRLVNWLQDRRTAHSKTMQARTSVDQLRSQSVDLT